MYQYTTATKAQHLVVLKDVNFRDVLGKALDKELVDTPILDKGSQWFYVRSDGIWFRYHFYHWELVYKLVNEVLFPAPVVSQPITEIKKEEVKEVSNKGKFEMHSHLFKTNKPVTTSNPEATQSLYQLRKEVEDLKEVIRAQSLLLDRYIVGQDGKVPLVLNRLRLTRHQEFDADGNRLIKVLLMCGDAIITEVRV